MKFPSENHIFCFYSVPKKEKEERKCWDKVKGYSGNVDAQSVNFLLSHTENLRVSRICDIMGDLYTSSVDVCDWFSHIVLHMAVYFSRTDGQTKA